MKRFGLAASVIAMSLGVSGCDEATHKAKEVIREQQSRMIENAADAAREKLNDTREDAQDSIGDSLRGGDEKEDAAKAPKEEGK